MLPEITAVICTHNRPPDFAHTLYSLCRQNFAANRYEILVIDNASAENIEEIVNQFIFDFSHLSIRKIIEPNLGLGYARNTGWQRATGEIVAYIDDDAVADKNWLDALVETLRSKPDVWSVGGKVLPIWDGERPGWLKDDLLNAISLLDRGDQACYLDWPDHLIGTNMAFRRQALEKLGGFDPLLGRRGSTLVGEEETDIQQRIHTLGGRVYYSPNAKVYHHIAAERLTKRYFYARSFGTGRSRAVMASRKANRLTKIWLLVRTSGSLSYYLLRVIVSQDGEHRFRNLRSAYGKWGFVRYMVSIIV